MVAPPPKALLALFAVGLVALLAFTSGSACANAPDAGPHAVRRPLRPVGVLTHLTPMPPPPPEPVPSESTAGQKRRRDDEEPPVPKPYSCRRGSEQLLLAIGIITAPTHFNRRVWIRQKLRVSEAACRGISVLFVLGSRNKMTRSQRLAIRFERRAHGDIVFVPARDWVPHAVAEKSLAWWQYAVTSLDARWYAKTDDDSLMYLPRLETDLQIMAGMNRAGRRISPRRPHTPATPAPRPPPSAALHGPRVPVTHAPHRRRQSQAPTTTTES